MRAYEIVDQTAQSLGCELVHIASGRSDSPVAWTGQDSIRAASLGPAVSGPSAIFRLSGGQGLWITVSLGLPADSPLAADIVFRYLQRLCQALAERLERFQTSTPPMSETETRQRQGPSPPAASARSSLGPFAGLFDRLVGRSEPEQGTAIKPVAASRAKAEALASPASGTRWMRSNDHERRRPWTESKPTKEMLPRPIAARSLSHSSVHTVQSGSGQVNVSLHQGAAAPFLDGAGRRRSPGDRDVDRGPQAAPVYLATAEIEINPPEIDPMLSTAGLARGRPARSVEPRPITCPTAKPGSGASGSPSRSSPTPALRRESSQYADPAVELF